MRKNRDTTVSDGADLSRSDAPLAVSALHTRLEPRTKEQLIALVERLASDSPELAARIDYLTDQVTAAKTLQRRITGLRNSRRFVAYRESHELAAQIDSLARDIEMDILPVDPHVALSLAEKLFSLDAKIFNRADDSGGAIGAALRNACVLWLSASAATRKAVEAAAAPATDWVATLYDLRKGDDYGVREPLLREASRLLTEPELRALAARFERDTLDVLEHAKRDDREFIRVFGPSTAMGMVAEALRDPLLYERSIRLYSPEPNELQSEKIAEHYLQCGDAAGALRWLQKEWEPRLEQQRLALLDRAYALLGDTARQMEIRRQAYEKAPSIHTYRKLEEVLPEAERAQFRVRACAQARSNPSVTSGAEILFALGEPILAEELIVQRVEELDGRYYGTLIELAQAAKAAGRFLAATLLFRALLDAILGRAYAKAYHHAADYLRELRELAPKVSGFRSLPTHEQYEAGLRVNHGRKMSFWAEVEGRAG